MLTITRNVRSVSDSAVVGALVRLSADREIATVLVSVTGKLARVEASTLVHTRGRPIKLIRGLCRADVDALINDSPEFCVDAIQELFGRQLESERVSLATFADNDVGFRADDARRGSLLALKSVWSEVDAFYARAVLHAYSGTQLWDIASDFLAEAEIVAATTVARSESETLIAEILRGAF